MFGHLVIQQAFPFSGEKGYKFEDFLSIYETVNQQTEQGTYADYMEAFKTFDREGQGYISGAEMRQVLSSLGTLMILSGLQYASIPLKKVANAALK